MDINSMPDIKTVTLIVALRISFAIHGLPYIIDSDNRPSFTSKEFKNVTHQNGVKPITNSITYTCHQIVQPKELFKLLNQKCVKL